MKTKNSPYRAKAKNIKVDTLQIEEVQVCVTRAIIKFEYDSKVFYIDMREIPDDYKILRLLQSKLLKTLPEYKNLDIDYSNKDYLLRAFYSIINTYTKLTKVIVHTHQDLICYCSLISHRATRYFTREEKMETIDSLIRECEKLAV